MVFDLNLFARSRRGPAAMRKTKPWRGSLDHKRGKHHARNAEARRQHVVGSIFAALFGSRKDATGDGFGWSGPAAHFDSSNPAPAGPADAGGDDGDCGGGGGGGGEPVALPLGRNGNRADRRLEGMATPQRLPRQKMRMQNLSFGGIKVGDDDGFDEFDEFNVRETLKSSLGSVEDATESGLVIGDDLAALPDHHGHQTPGTTARVVAAVEPLLNTTLVHRLTRGLAAEDPIQPSARLKILKAIYRRFRKQRATLFRAFLHSTFVHLDDPEAGADEHGDLDQRPEKQKRAAKTGGGAAARPWQGHSLLRLLKYLATELLETVSVLETDLEQGMDALGDADLSAQSEAFKEAERRRGERERGEGGAEGGREDGAMESATGSYDCGSHDWSDGPLTQAHLYQRAWTVARRRLSMLLRSFCNLCKSPKVVVCQPWLDIMGECATSLVEVNPVMSSAALLMYLLQHWPRSNGIKEVRAVTYVWLVDVRRTRVPPSTIETTALSPCRLTLARPFPPSLSPSTSSPPSLSLTHTRTHATKPSTHPSPTLPQVSFLRLVETLLVVSHPEHLLVSAQDTTAGPSGVLGLTALIGPWGTLPLSTEAAMFGNAPPPRRRPGWADKSVHALLFDRIAQCICAQQAQVARQALAMAANMCVLHLYIMRFPQVVATVKESLVKNRNHWNPTVQTMSDELFDRLLDFA
jgi:hypothetical protein